MSYRVAVVTGMALALIGCGGSGAPGGGAGTLAAGGWDGTKACDTLKQADVDAVTGQKSQPGKIDGVHAASEGGAATSMCSYMLLDGRAVTFLSRVSSGEDLAQAVNSAKNPPAGMSMGKLDDVAGVGKAALWNDKVGQLQFWLDGDHYGIVGIQAGDFTKKPDLSQAKPQAIALAHKLGG